MVVDGTMQTQGRMDAGMCLSWRAHRGSQGRWVGVQGRATARDEGMVQGKASNQGGQTREVSWWYTVNGGMNTTKEGSPSPASFKQQGGAAMRAAGRQRGCRQPTGVF